MNGEEKIQICQNELEFRMHVTDVLGRIDERTLALKTQNANQFQRIEALEKMPRKMMVGVTGVAAVISGLVAGVVEAWRRTT